MAPPAVREIFILSAGGRSRHLRYYSSLVAEIPVRSSPGFLGGSIAISFPRKTGTLLFLPSSVCAELFLEDPQQHLFL